MKLLRNLKAKVKKRAVLRSNSGNRAAKVASAKLKELGYDFGPNHGKPRSRERAVFDSLVKMEAANRKKAAAHLIRERMKLKGRKYVVSPKKFVR